MGSAITYVGSGFSRTYITYVGSGFLTAGALAQAVSRTWRSYCFVNATFSVVVSPVLTLTSVVYFR